MPAAVTESGRLAGLKARIKQLVETEELDRKLTELWQKAAPALAELEELRSKYGLDLAELDSLGSLHAKRLQGAGLLVLHDEARSILGDLSQGIERGQWAAAELQKKTGRAPAEELVRKMEATNGLAATLRARIDAVFNGLPR